MLSPAPMPFKTIRRQGVLPRLRGFSVLDVSGPDSAAFLQAQTMNDVVQLAPGHWQWNGWLNPKGRVICLFALLRNPDDGFVAVLPDFPAAELQLLLQRYVFRSKVRLDPGSGLVATADLSSGTEVDAGGRDRVTGSRSEGLHLDLGGEGGPRAVLLLPGSSERIGEEVASVDAEWSRLDLAHGLPRLGPDQREGWTPQMLSLERLRAYSLKKGCYPGQEIVARTHYLGQAKRQLSRIEGLGLETGESVRDAAGTPIGMVVSVTPGRDQGLAVVPAGHSLAGARAGDHPVLSLRLLGGLERPV